MPYKELFPPVHHLPYHKLAFLFLLKLSAPKRPPRGSEKRQSWTRCRIPVDKPIPSNLALNAKEWSRTLLFLRESPGYRGSTSGRSVENPEEVVFIVNWKNEESLQAFRSSPGFSIYLQIFFGVDDLSRAPSFAFFTLAPGTLNIGHKLIVFTLSYAHPVAPENRHLRHGGPCGAPRWSQQGLRKQTAWVREPQRSVAGQLVDIAMGVHTCWPPVTDIDIDAVISTDPFIQMEWDGEVQRITPISIERTIWDTKPSAEEAKEELDQQMREDEAYEDDWEYEDDNEDHFEEDYDMLIVKQLLSE